MTRKDKSSHEFSTTLGIGRMEPGWGGMYTQSSTRSLDRAVGFKWKFKKYARSFRMGAIYQKVKEYYGRCDKPYFVIWKPLEIGSGSYGFGENKLEPSDRPDWATCSKIYSDGVWFRNTVGGEAYSYGAGVKMDKIIGIDLSVKRSYTGEARLAYAISTSKSNPKRLCGNNDTYPNKAGKVMEKAYLTPMRQR